MAKYEGVLFDLDGTLIDSFLYHSRVIYLFLANRGYSPSEEQVSKNIGNTMTCVLDGCKVPKAAQKNLVTDIDKFYLNEAKTQLDKLNFVSGAKETINKIRSNNIKTGIVTNSKHVLACEIIRRNNVSDMFDFINGAGTYTLNKEARCNKVISDMDIEPVKILYVGDTVHDIHLARKCGMDVCIVKEYGWESDYDKLINKHNPEYVVDKITDVINCIN